MFLNMILTTALLGFSGSFHCAVMCGPLAGSACGGSRQIGISYHLARITTYTLLGFASGILTSTLSKLYFTRFTHVFSLGFAAIVLTVAVMQLTSFSFHKKPLHFLNPKLRTRFNGILSQAISASPFSKPATLGVATAFLPCGFLYLGLVQAALFAHPLKSAAAMGVFAISTTPALWLGTGLALGIKKYLPRRTQYLFPVLSIFAAFFVVARSFNFPENTSSSQPAKSEMMCHEP